VHETFGWIGRDIEDGYDFSHTGGIDRLRLDLDRLETVATRTLRGNRALTIGNRRKVSGNH
jgi:hemerythrin superfamily protein